MTPALILGTSLLATIALHVGMAFWIRHWLRRETAEYARQADRMAEGLALFDEASERYRAATLRHDTAYVRNTLEGLQKACTPAAPGERRTWLKVVDGRRKEAAGT